MNAWLVAIALGLLAAWPLTIAGSLIGFLAERLTRSPRVREIAWGATFLLPFLFLLQVLGGRIFAGASVPTPAVAAHMARVHLTVPLSSFAPPSAPPLFETWLARPEAVWIAVVILALSLGGAIARVAVWTAGKQRLSYVIKRASALDAPDLDRALVHEAALAHIHAPAGAGQRRDRSPDARGPAPAGDPDPRGGGASSGCGAPSPDRTARTRAPAARRQSAPSARGGLARPVLYDAAARPGSRANGGRHGRGLRRSGPARRRPRCSSTLRPSPRRHAPARRRSGARSRFHRRR